MARLDIIRFEFRLIAPAFARMTVDYEVFVTPTEARLEIPSSVYFRLMERDGERDPIDLYANWRWARPEERSDDSASGWMFAASFTRRRRTSFVRVFRRAELPGENGVEEWYVVGQVRPDIVADLRFSNEVALNAN